MDEVGMSENRPNPNRPWREIVEEVAKECDSDKVAELSQELIKALDRQSPHAPERDKQQVRRKSA
jgi:hypothetical protein